jgi:hypothetical protein
MGKRIVILAIIALAGIFVTSSQAIICEPFICGDCNDDGNVNILDVTCIIDFYYCYEDWSCDEQAAWKCENAMDVNGDCALMYNDITYLINYLYKGGPAPHCDCP